MAVYDAVINQLELLHEQGKLTAENEALGELALNLARTLDNGAGLAAAAVSRELRTTLAEIAKAGTDDSDAKFGDWVSGLSTALGDSPFA